ncbi:MAG: hypothetical protein KY428_03695, partial [Bacteroidetes bacterium]|nr:hypothetical protein [Bacteroidota bacterium]
VFSMANILMRVSFILLFSNAFFSRGSNIIWAYGIMALFVLLALVTLLLQYYHPFSGSKAAALAKASGTGVRGQEE